MCAVYLGEFLLFLHLQDHYTPKIGSCTGHSLSSLYFLSMQRDFSNSIHLIDFVDPPPAAAQ